MWVSVSWWFCLLQCKTCALVLLGTRVRCTGLCWVTMRRGRGLWCWRTQSLKKSFSTWRRTWSPFWVQRNSVSKWSQQMTAWSRSEVFSHAVYKQYVAKGCKLHVSASNSVSWTLKICHYETQKCSVLFLNCAQFVNARYTKIHHWNNFTFWLFRHYCRLLLYIR